ncbi:MAG: glycosyl hydrolase, partial [Gemmatimonadetes bacterium]|nr:glycosyl hydrolase [Gemmatimonadota bacterium]NIR81015.1 glycosyl hydrolase [Gemmatimonadota bacterium]NIT89832.1 glycosyl hydrolase [Gemmatimonadota bacterium]NIU33621.1 glycosyl hydrolase [Gemmatimonadota bacterium]NIU37878.1 glycosyl hydrolase [Gemmatimonadota bacterium]
MATTAERRPVAPAPAARRRVRPARRAVPALLSLALSVPLTTLGAQDLASHLNGSVRYRHIGPEGNRADAAVGEPGNPLVAYVGAASGGIWRTMDGGDSWEPIFDDTDVSSVNALAVAPTAPNEVWAGTGETFIIREGLSIGNGVWKSTDRGETWRHVGLERTGRISEIVVHPRDPDVIYACALGSGWESQEERGVYRTSDGGDTWERVLAVDRETGCSDLAIDPNDPETLIAGMWQLSIRTWNLASGGPGGGIFVTRDGGDTWTQVRGRGMTTDPIGKSSVAIARTTSRMYALLVEDVSPALYRSDDRGRTWTLVNRSQKMSDRSFYYTDIAVAPDDENRVYFQSIRLQMSIDGGESLVEDPPGGSFPGGLFDTHRLWIDPTDPARILVADDGGAGLSLNRGETWERVRLPIAQMYDVYTDNAVPYHVYANRQDGPSYRGPSNSRTRGGITLSLWHSVGGGESGYAVPDTTTNRIVWSGSFDGTLERFDLTTMQARSVRVWPETEDGWSPADLKYRWNWTFPIAISPHDPALVYVGSQLVHVTRDGGQSWSELSPDLTQDDEARQMKSGGMVYDIIGTFIWGTLWSIAESPVQEGVIWTGSNDGLVHVTRDGGDTWENVTSNLPDLPPDGKISRVEPSHFDVATAYATVDRHMLGDYEPYLYKTTDFGGSWNRIDAGIPRSTFSYLHIVREDPNRAGVLYVGTENRVYVSTDDGAHWSSLQLNMPPAPVYWLTVQPHFDDLVVATYGRGIWILDDVATVRELAPGVLDGPAHLFRPRDAYRFRRIESRVSADNVHVVGENPPYGANLDYHMAGAPDGPV